MEHTRKKNGGMAIHIRKLDSYFRHKDSVRMNALSCCSSDTIYDQQVGSLFNDYRGGPRRYANCAYVKVDDSRGSGHRDLSNGATVIVLHRLCLRTDAEMPEGPCLAWYGREFQQIADGQWVWDWGTIVKTTACKRHR